MANFNNTTTLAVDSTLYNDLNRAYREWDASVTDCYYYIVNGGEVDGEKFNTLIKEAAAASIEYAHVKNVVSENLVIPSLVEQFKVDSNKEEITNNWNINFDNSYKCDVTNIKIGPITVKEIYSGELADEYVDKTAVLQEMRDVLNQVIAKLNSTGLNEFGERQLKVIKNMRNDFSSKLDVNMSEFTNGYVADILKTIEKQANAANITWYVLPYTKTLTLVEKC